MSKIFGGPKQPKVAPFVPPKAVAAPPPAVSVAAAPVTEVTSGGDSGADTSPDELRKKYRPSKGIGSTGTGLSL